MAGAPGGQVPVWQGSPAAMDRKKNRVDSAKNGDDMQLATRLGQNYLKSMKNLLLQHAAPYICHKLVENGVKYSTSGNLQGMQAVKLPSLTIKVCRFQIK